MSDLTMKQKGIRALLKAVDGRPQFPFGENMIGNPALTDDDGNYILPVYRVVEIVLDAALAEIGPLYQINVDALGVVTDPFSGNPLYPLAAEMLSNFEKHGALVQVYPDKETTE